jgi:hypothetical protein
MDQEELNSLIKQFNEQIPDHTWDRVKDAAIAQIVDFMGLETLLKIAEMSLSEYYHEHQDEIITDLISFIGIDATAYMLDSLQLDKVPTPSES